jgi:hypothetical protein
MPARNLGERSSPTRLPLIGGILGALLAIRSQKSETGKRIFKQVLRRWMN